MESTIHHNLAVIHQRIKAAALRSGRDPDTIQLLLATKTVSPERIRIALLHGETLIGENRVQELKEKYTALADLPHQTHFIGHLQTNKIKEVLRYAGCIQSVDRPALAEKMDHYLQQEGRRVDVLLQVNTSYETSKFGMAPELLPSFAKEVAARGTLRIKGLMTIGLFSAAQEEVRSCFRMLRTLQTTVRALVLPDVSMDVLSMGMSGDMETAIEEGSTLIRVGTAVFGTRIYPDSFYWDERK